MISKVMRFMSEKLTDIRGTILLYQIGHIKSKKAATASPVTALFIPVGSDMNNINQVLLTPVVSTNSANDVALASGYQLAAGLFAASDCDAWVKNTTYEEDQIVYDSVSGKAYHCIAAHTSTNEDNAAATGFVKDKATYWSPISSTGFVKVTFATPGDAKILDVNVLVIGY